MKRSLLIALAACLYLASAVISYALFSASSRNRTSTPVPFSANSTPPVKKSKIDPNLPKTEPCPLNGALFTVQEKDIWSDRRPLAVMIENHVDSRPTSGLDNSDIVYEAIAEGGITRFMGIFYCAAAADNITLAPVRSARIYFVRLVPEYDALYNHVGGAGNCDDSTVNEKAKALCFIKKNNIKDMDQFGRAGDFKTCHRLTNRLDREVAYEHTMACFTDEIYRVAATKYNWSNLDAKGISWDKNFKPWKFKSDSQVTPTASVISFGFWSNKPDYDVTWKYDPSTNSYLREDGGQKPIDLNTGGQLSARNVVVQFVKESGPLDEHMHMYYEVIGSGKALVFLDGQVISATWSKPTVSSRTKFTGPNNKEIEFNRGRVWIELVPSGNTVNYN